MHRHFILYLSVVTVGLLPLTSFAQNEATSTPVTAEETWYEVERLIGRVDVGDFVVGPGRTEIELEPGESAIQYITVANRISDDRTFLIQVEDITGTTDGSSALRVLDGERGPYSVRDYITFPEDTITLGLGERARVPVRITVPADAEPGGYYGSVLISTIRNGSSDGNTPSNPIIARVGSHFFVTVPGEQLESGSLTDISTLPSQWWYESGPITFALAYENTGSVHVNPYGELRIRNIFGSEVGYQVLDPWFVLPQSVRSREVTWSQEFLFGRYVATAEINRGYDDIVDTQSVVFWVLPWRFLAIIAASVFVIAFLVRLFFKTFEFKRKS